MYKWGIVVRLDFVYLQNVVCSSVGTVAASVRLLYIHFRSLYAGNHSTYSLCTTAGKIWYTQRGWHSLSLGRFILQFEAIFTSQVTYALLTARSGVCCCEIAFQFLSCISFWHKQQSFSLWDGVLNLDVCRSISWIKIIAKLYTILFSCICFFFWETLLHGSHGWYKSNSTNVYYQL